MAREDHLAALNAPAKEATSSSGWNKSSSFSSLAPNLALSNTTDSPAALPPPPPPASSPSPRSSYREWNTSKLGLRVGVDALSAGSAATLVAPVITMIDKAIMENASGRNPLGVSLRKSLGELLVAPHRFVGSKPFALIFTLYSGTYFTANSIDTISSTLHPKTSTPSTVTAGTTKFLATSFSNLSICLYKDSQFTRLFSAPGSIPRPVPLPTYALFVVRDSLTIFASFNLPPLIAPRLEQRMSAEVSKYVGAASIAQFTAPAAVQLFSTPLHLLGLDLYNRPAAPVGGKDGRVAKVLANWAKSAAARICRIVPAFGVGGVVNMKVRKGAMGRLE